MGLNRASCQSSKTLESFYQGLAESDDSVSAAIGRQMLALLPMLKEMCVNRSVWGLTSLSHLWLLASDDFASPWLVSITAHPAAAYKVRYRLPDDQAPWPDALVEGFAQDEAQACQLIAIAMRRCKGWA